MRFPRTFQIEKSLWVYSTVNEIKHISRHIIMNFLNTGDKEETPKCSWEQTQVTDKRSGIRITLVSSTVILKAERQNVSKSTKEKWFSTWNSIPKGEGWIKTTFSAIQWIKNLLLCQSAWTGNRRLTDTEESLTIYKSMARVKGTEPEMLRYPEAGRIRELLQR